MIERVQPAVPSDIAHAIAALPATGEAERWLSGRDSGLWTSDDGGLTWEQVAGLTAPGGQLTFTTFALAPEGKTVFAGAFGAVLKSINGGRSWRSVALPEPAPLVTCLAVSPAYDEDGVVLAGTLEDGVLRSDDRGERWRRWSFGLLDLSVYALAASPAFAEDETLFAGTETALFTSENGGRSWRETAFPDTAAPVLALALDRHGDLWAGTDGHGLWRSPDNGATWTRSDACAITEPVNGLIQADSALLAVLPEAILISPDQGHHWHTAISDLSEGGGIAGVAPLPRRVTADANGPSPVPEGLRGVQRGLQSSAATPAIASDLLIQLRNGAVRRLRIALDNQTEKGNR